ncbi:MAG: hypothetical protein OXM55_00240 [Bdellovibrionales bacterium]|nr:hypothetical protein [Bdellovibrionales bacterium]
MFLIKRKGKLLLTPIKNSIICHYIYKELLLLHGIFLDSHFHGNDILKNNLIPSFSVTPAFSVTPV